MGHVHKTEHISWARDYLYASCCLKQHVVYKTVIQHFTISMQMFSVCFFCLFYHRSVMYDVQLFCVLCDCFLLVTFSVIIRNVATVSVNVLAKPLKTYLFESTCRHSALSYLLLMCIPLFTDITRRHLRSATHEDLSVPRTKTVRYGPQSFAVCGSTCWNSLLSSLKSMLFSFCQTENHFVRVSIHVSAFIVNLFTSKSVRT